MRERARSEFTSEHARWVGRSWERDSAGWNRLETKRRIIGQIPHQKNYFTTVALRFSAGGFD